MESNLYSLFRVNIENLVRNSVHLSRHWHISVTELYKMPYWEYEFRMDEINKTIEEEKKQEKEQKDSMEAVKDPDRFMRSAQRQYQYQMPKLPSVPKLPSMPKI